MIHIKIKGDAPVRPTGSRSHIKKVTRGIIKNLIGFTQDDTSLDLYYSGDTNLSKSLYGIIRKEVINFCIDNNIRINKKVKVSKTKGNHGGYKPNKAGTLYFIKIGENTLGYGVSNNFKTRLTQHKRTFNDGGVEFEVLHTVEFEDGQHCLDAENLLKRNLPHNGCDLKGFKTEATALSYYTEAVRLVGTIQ